jgi:hypothetical protein
VKGYKQEAPSQCLWINVRHWVSAAIEMHN